jgi:hypothetical protein
VPQGVCAANVLKSKIGASEALMEADQERQFCSMEERLAMAAALRRPFPGTV